MAYQGKRAITPEKKKKEKVIKQPTNEQSIVMDNDVVDISSKSTKAVHKKRNTIIQVVAIVMAVIFVACGGALVYASSIIGSITDDSADKDTKNYTVKDDRGNGVISDSKLLANKDVLNVMLFGQDNKESKYDAGRSDTMILLSVDVTNKQIKLTSFLRDTYVYIPSGDDFEGWYKLNAAYSHGGAKLTVKTIESNFGIKIDRYAIVDFSGFKDIIDALGGLTIPITGNEARYINAQIEHNNQKCPKVAKKYCKSVYKKDKNGKYSYDRNGDKVEITRKVKLTGKQALWYARNRGSTELGGENFSGNDWDRTDRQRKVIKALIDEFKGASFTSLLSAVQKVGPMVQTNFKSNEITSLLTSAFKIMKYPMYQFNVPIGEESDPNKLWFYNTYYPNGQKYDVVEINDWKKTRSKVANFVFNKVTDKKSKLKYYLNTTKIHKMTILRVF